MRDGYFRSTRHPWPCLLFLLPLLVAYEGGVMWLSEAQGDALRTGTDSWLRWVLQEFGLGAMCFPPIIIAAIFVIWNSLRLADRPRDTMGIWLGMAAESVAFALILWSLGRLQDPLLEKTGILEVSRAGVAPGLAQAVSFLGAGIYEELLFRLMLFPLLLKLLSLTEMSTLLAIGLAMVGSSVAFSAAHHVGPFGELYDPRVFLFRSLAGMYFATIFQFRGFGIAVGTRSKSTRLNSSHRL